MSASRDVSQSPRAQGSVWWKTRPGTTSDAAMALMTLQAEKTPASQRDVFLCFMLVYTIYTLRSVCQHLERTLAAGPLHPVDF